MYSTYYTQNDDHFMNLLDYFMEWVEYIFNIAPPIDHSVSHRQIIAIPLIHAPCKKLKDNHCSFSNTQSDEIEMTQFTDSHSYYSKLVDKSNIDR